MQKSNWTKYKLGNFCLIKTKTITPLPNQRYYLYSLPGFDNHKTPEFVYGKDIKSNKFLVEGNGILYNKLNIQFKRIWKVPQTSEWPMICSTEFLPIYPTNDIDFNFFYYILTSGAFSNSMRSCSTGTSNSHQRIKLENILNYELFLPSLHEQKKIADILGAFDDKIELLQKQNTTLENMAKALFKSWFVDFDVVHAKQQGQPKAAVMQQYHLTEELYNLFPSSFEPSALGPIPTSWQVKPLSQIATFLNGLALQKYPANDNINYLPVIKIAELRNGLSTSSDRASCDIPAEYIVYNGDILFSWSGSLMVKIWPGKKGALNQHLFKVASLEYPKWFYYMWIKYHLPFFQEIAADKATTMGHIQRKHLDQALVCIPKNLNIYTRYFASLIDKQILNNKQIQTLTEMRDALLPHLISGKIRV